MFGMVPREESVELRSTAQAGPPFLHLSIFGAGDEGAGSEDVAEGIVGGFADADARSDLDFAGMEGVFTDPQSRRGRR